MIYNVLGGTLNLAQSFSCNMTLFQHSHCARPSFDQSKTVTCALAVVVVANSLTRIINAQI